MFELSFGAGLLFGLGLVLLIAKSRLRTVSKGRIFTVIGLLALVVLWSIMPPSMKTPDVLHWGKVYALVIIIFQAIGEVLYR